MSCGVGGGGEEERERERLFKKRFSCSHTDVIIYEELYEHEQHSKRSIVSQTPVQNSYSVDRNACIGQM